MWSAGALAAVTVALNMTSFTGARATPEPAATAEAVEPEAKKDEPAINIVLKRTVSDRDFVPFEDFEYRIRQMEREMPPQPQNSEANPQNIPPR
jgi:hypothetical protein